MGKSSTKQVGQANNLSPEQTEALKAIFGSLDPSGATSNLANPESANAFFDKNIATPQRQQFEQDVLPQLLEQFAGATSGSGFNRAIGRSASDFETQLAAQRAGFQRDSQTQQIDLLKSLLGLRAVDPIIRQGKPGFLSNFGSGLGTAIGAAAGSEYGKGGS